jgi:phosphate starvation-inducible PhoH-like protein
MRAAGALWAARIRRISCAIEQKLGVRVAMRGNLSRSKARQGARAGGAVLRALYARIEAARRRAWRRSTPKSASPARAEKLPAGDFGAPSIKTAAARVTRARSPAQGAYLDLMRTHPLVFGVGPAGTGKTYLAAAFGAHLLYERRVERLILSRPALEAGERLGFLPGDLKEKIDPYLRPLYDALFDVMGEQCVKLMEAGHHRSGAARLHARPHADARFRHSRRGAELLAVADEDVL